MASEHIGKKEAGKSRREKSAAKAGGRLPPQGDAAGEVFARHPPQFVYRPEPPVAEAFIAEPPPGTRAIKVESPHVELPRLHSLPQRSATQVKNQWADLVREVRNSGGVAVTSHDRVEMVVMEAATYQQVASLAAGKDAADQAALQRLTVEFDRRIAAMRREQTPARIKQVLKARGRAKRRPKAGSSF